MYPMYARGGKIKRGKMIVAHFNPHELNELDHLQGKKETCPHTGMRSYAHLEEILKNPHIFRNLMNNVQAGTIKRTPSNHDQKTSEQRPHDYKNAELNEMADKGVHGDSELALIGPHTRHTFDSIIEMNGKSPSHNPESGHPHYWELNGFTSGLGQMFSPPPSSLGQMGASNTSTPQSPTPGMNQFSSSSLGGTLGNMAPQSYAPSVGSINPQGMQGVSTPTQPSPMASMGPGMQGERRGLEQYGRSMINPSSPPPSGLNNQRMQNTQPTTDRMYGGQQQQKPPLPPQEGGLRRYTMGQYGTPQPY